MGTWYICGRKDSFGQNVIDSGQTWGEFTGVGAMMKTKYLLGAVLVVTVLAVFSSGALASVDVLTWKGAIGPTTSRVIADAVAEAELQGREAFILRLDTPGGLVSSTRDIVQAFLNADVPTVVYVSPSGAGAASAGMYITISAQIAAMAPGTNIGAAHTVGPQGGIADSVMNEKIEQDAASYVRAIAGRRDRNIEWVQNAVLHSVSITATEAVDSNVVDLVAESLDDLLAQLDGMVVNLPSGIDTLHTAGADINEIELSWRDRFLKVITSPEIAYILLSLGGFGIMMELYNPGTFVPGTIGAISLIIGFYGLQRLPLNYAGLALIGLAFVLFALEIKVLSHGVLTIGGVVSMLMGSLMLIDSSEPYMRISLSVIFAVVGTTAAFFIFAIGFAMRIHKKKPTTGDVGLVGQIGTVKEKIDPEGLIYVAGEYWRARAESPLTPGMSVKVTAVENMILRVDKIE